MNHYVQDVDSLTIGESCSFRDCLIEFLDCANVAQFWDAMTIFKMNTCKDKDKPPVSPMRLLIRAYPELAKMALDRCMGTNLANPRPDKKGLVILGNIYLQ